MAQKIVVQIILLDNGTFLFHPKTHMVYEYKAPHNPVGRLDLKKFKIVKSIL